MTTQIESVKLEPVQLGPAEIEQRLFDSIKNEFSKQIVFGHISVVHARKWLVCWIFAWQEEVGHKKFMEVTRHARMELVKLGQTICEPRNKVSGIDPLGVRYFNVWLTGPERTAKDFIKFYPLGFA